MKRVFLICLMVVSFCGVSAQESRDEMHNMLCNKLVEVLALDDERRDEFVEIYSEYARTTKFRALRPPREGRGGGGRAELSQEQIEAKILDSFEQSIRSIELKREYYAKFRKVLSPSEISRMYEFERRIRDHAVEEQRRRMHGLK